jgi:Alpha/beta hydrolase family
MVGRAAAALAAAAGGLPMVAPAFSSGPEAAARSAAIPRPPFGLVPNEPHQDPGGAVFREPDYTLAIVEFDDQGVCYDRRQLHAVAAALEPLRGRGAVVLVFVHGWRHNGCSDDSNLDSFHKLLAQTSLDAAGRPVFGVFVAWRGLSWYGPHFLPIDYLTFWSRKEAALRVALGSVRELLGRLREFRNDQVGKPGEALFVVVGHSFGGLIVYSAVAQSLIEAAATEQGRAVPSFANLVLLVNPAFEAARYLPVFEQIKGNHGFVPDQPPVFVCVQAMNDDATKYAFPLGAGLGTIGESTRGWDQRQALLHTMGHLSWMRTHDLSAPGARLPASSQPHSPPSKSRGPADMMTSGGQPERRSSRGALLTRLPTFPADNPFWVVSATPEVVDGHNGIFGDVFVGFVHDLVGTHMARAGSLP